MRSRIAETVHAYRVNPPPLPADEVLEALAFSTGSRATISSSSGAASTGCRAATPPPTRSRIGSRRSCATPPCASCGAGANSWS
jgi:glutamate dehydrogenase